MLEETADVAKAGADTWKKTLDSSWAVVSDSGTEDLAFSGEERKCFVCRSTDRYRKFADSLGPRSLVVEIGCANGFCTKRILARCAKENVLGLDISGSFIRECREKFPDVSFVKGDVLFDWKTVESLGEGFIHARSKVQSDGLGLDLVVFIDIGGNRELESLVALVPAVLEAWSPRAVVVKSETLHAYGSTNGLGERSWSKLRELGRAALIRRRPRQARAEREYHPLRMPARMNSEGVAICRYHNYDQKKGCLRFKDLNNYGNICQYDHETCHSCLQRGHRAFECLQRDNPLIESLVKDHEGSSV